MGWIILAVVVLAGVYVYASGSISGLSTATGDGTTPLPGSDQTGSDSDSLANDPMNSSDGDDVGNLSASSGGGDSDGTQGLSDLTSEIQTAAAQMAGGPSPSIQAIAQAIASAEGFGPAGAIPTKANNPGDLCVGDIGYGTITSSGGEKITVFQNAPAGWQALYNQIALWINGGSRNINTSMTWAQIGAKYAGPSTPWAANVAAQLGVDVNSTLGDYING